MADRIVDGVSYSTIAGAYADVQSDEWIILRINISNEFLNLNKNFVGIKSDNGSYWDRTDNSNLITISSGLTQLFKIQDIELRKSAGNGHTIQLVNGNLGVGAKFEFRRIYFNRQHTGNQECLRLGDSNGTDTFIVDRCRFVSNSGSYGIFFLNFTDADSYTITNCIIEGSDAGFEGIRCTESTTNTMGVVYNCTIVGCNKGLNISHRGSFINNLLANNTDDITFGGSSNIADITYSAFEQADEALGATNLCSNQGTAITSTDEFVDEGSDDYHLKSTADCKDAGTNTGATPDYDGVSRPQGSAYDIGAYEYEVNGDINALLFATNF